MPKYRFSVSLWHEKHPTLLAAFQEVQEAHSRATAESIVRAKYGSRVKYVIGLGEVPETGHKPAPLPTRQKPEPSRRDETKSASSGGGIIGLVVGLVLVGIAGINQKCSAPRQENARIEAEQKMKVQAEEIRARVAADQEQVAKQAAAQQEEDRIAAAKKEESMRASYEENLKYQREETARRAKELAEREADDAQRLKKAMDEARAYEDKSRGL